VSLRVHSKLTGLVAGLGEDVEHDATRDVSVTSFSSVRTRQRHDIQRQALTQRRHVNCVKSELI